MGKVCVLVAIYETDKEENKICIGEGFSVVEAVVNAVNLNYTDVELKNIMDVYFNDFVGLSAWYKEQGYVLSEPSVLPSK